MTKLFSDLAESGPSSLGGAGLWVRRSAIAVFVVVVALALLDQIGQQPHDAVAQGPAARLRLSAPKVVRGGLFFQSRVEIRALQAIDSPRVVLDTGWAEGMQINSIEPQPSSESSRDGLLELSFDKLEAGDLLRLWLEFEANPTQPGRRPYGIEIDDHTQPLARVERTITVMP